MKKDEIACTSEEHRLCKIDCLLKAYNELADKHNALIDRAVKFIDIVIGMTSYAEDYEIDFQLKMLQDILRDGKVGREDGE